MLTRAPGFSPMAHGLIWIVCPVTIQVTLHNEAVTALAISSLQERGIDGMLTKTRGVRKKISWRNQHPYLEYFWIILRLLCCEQKGITFLKHSRLGMGQVHQPSMDGLIWKYAIFVGPLVRQFWSILIYPGNVPDIVLASLSKSYMWKRMLRQRIYIRHRWYTGNICIRYRFVGKDAPHVKQFDLAWVLGIRKLWNTTN